VDGDISALINLLGSETDVTILSNPTLLATDNKEASITVGGREPIVTQQATDLTGDTSTIVNSVQYEETGIILSVVPHINAGGLVRMEVEQTIRDAVANTISGIDSPRFTERKINTTLIAQNGNTVVIGGIIQTNSEKTNTGIPYLNKIPIISPLFSSKSNNTDRTELIIAITPRVVTHNRRDTTSREFYERLMQLKRRIEREGAGGI
jgi:general secretion pathway protein D